MFYRETVLTFWVNPVISYQKISCNVHGSIWVTLLSWFHLIKLETSIRKDTLPPLILSLWSLTPKHTSAKTEFQTYMFRWRGTLCCCFPKSGVILWSYFLYKNQPKSCIISPFSFTTMLHPTTQWIQQKTYLHSPSNRCPILKNKLSYRQPFSFTK